MESQPQLPVTFTATLERRPGPGGWTYVRWPASVSFFGTRGLVKVHAEVDGVPFRTSFMATGEGTHMLPVARRVRAQIHKEAGDQVDVVLTESLVPGRGAR